MDKDKRIAMLKEARRQMSRLRGTPEEIARKLLYLQLYRAYEQSPELAERLTEELGMSQYECWGELLNLLDS